MSRFIYYYAECHYAECRYAECRYAECRYDECCVLFIALNVVIPIAVMLSVVAPVILGEIFGHLL